MKLGLNLGLKSAKFKLLYYTDLKQKRTCFFTVPNDNFHRLHLSSDNTKLGLSQQMLSERSKLGVNNN